MVDVGWSRLSDLNFHEGKLLGCSYNQSCVGVWVVDISVNALKEKFLRLIGMLYLIPFNTNVPFYISDLLSSV